jgi:hypothetical protein
MGENDVNCGVPRNEVNKMQCDCDARMQNCEMRCDEKVERAMQEKRCEMRTTVYEVNRTALWIPMALGYASGSKKRCPGKKTGEGNARAVWKESRMS